MEVRNTEPAAQPQDRPRTAGVLGRTRVVAAWIKEYDAKPDRFGPDAARLNEEPRIDHDLYVRGYRASASSATSASTPAVTSG